MNYWIKSVRTWMEKHSHHVEEIPDPPLDLPSEPYIGAWSRSKKVDFEWPKNPPPPLMTTMLSSPRDYDKLVELAKEEKEKEMVEYFQTIGAIAGLCALLLIVAYWLGSSEG